jgi:DNA-binding XRE family transcriptional regulator
MPRGIPNDPNAPRKGGYYLVTKDDLRSRIKEIEERIKRMDRREKALGDLKKWMANRKLEVSDMVWMLKTMKPKRAAQAVKSKLPLQPVKERASPGYIMSGGKLIAPKGDPEFRRRIMEARKAKGWNSEAVGKKLGVSHATVSSWEAGRYVPKEEVRVKLLMVLELPAGLGAAATKAMIETMKTAARRGGNAAASPD